MSLRCSISNTWKYLVFAFLPLILLLLGDALAQEKEEFEFDIAETEKKPYSLGGYGEFRPVLLGLDRDSAFIS